MLSILLMSIRLYERGNRLKEDLNRNTFRYAGMLVGFGLGMYVTRNNDNYMLIIAGVFLPALLGNIIGSYIDATRR